MTFPRTLTAAVLAVSTLALPAGRADAQAPATDANTPLHLLKPNNDSSMQLYR